MPISARRGRTLPVDFLTASAGVGSDSLSSLFSHGMQVGRSPLHQPAAVHRRQQPVAAALCGSGEKGLIATYEKSIQSAFKDVADALARRETLSEELDAQRQYVAAETSLDIAMKSYQAGVGDYLSVLTAQRTLWSAKRRCCPCSRPTSITGSPSGSRWAAAPVKLTRRATEPGLYKESLWHVFPSRALILGLLSGIGPLCTDFYLPALPEITQQLQATSTRPSCR